MSEVRCATCPYYDARPSGKGVCRVEPPKIAGERFEAIWPVVGADDWCRMHPALVDQRRSEGGVKTPEGR